MFRKISAVNISSMCRRSARSATSFDSMAKCSDLPNTVLKRIIAILGASSPPCDQRKSLSALLHLCRVDRRVCGLSCLETYRTVEFTYGCNLETYFAKSDITKVPKGTLRKLLIRPGYKDSLSLLEEAAGLSDQNTIGVQYLEIYLCWQSGNMLDTQPEYYLPIFEATNPKTLVFDSGFSPVDMHNCKCEGPKIAVSTFLQALSSYTQIAFFRMPLIDFESTSDQDFSKLAKRPLKHLCLDCPTFFSPTIVCKLLVSLPKLRQRALVVSSQCARLSCEMDMAFDEEDNKSFTDLEFEERNDYLYLPTIEK